MIICNDNNVKMKIMKMCNIMKIMKMKILIMCVIICINNNV